jgi:septal ring factor EnvC (AmiA/AmiB activator)
MKIHCLAAGLMGSILMFTPMLTLAGGMSPEMTLEEATAEIERLEQENISLNEQIEANEMTISEYKEQMAAIEAEIADLQAQLDSR